MPQNSLQPNFMFGLDVSQAPPAYQAVFDAWRRRQVQDFFSAPQQTAATPGPTLAPQQTQPSGPTPAVTPAPAAPAIQQQQAQSIAPLIGGNPLDIFRNLTGSNLGLNGPSGIGRDLAAAQQRFGQFDNPDLAAIFNKSSWRKQTIGDRINNTGAGWNPQYPLGMVLNDDALQRAAAAIQAILGLTQQARI